MREKEGELVDGLCLFCACAQSIDWWAWPAIKFTGQKPLEKLKNLISVFYVGVLSAWVAYQWSVQGFGLVLAYDVSVFRLTYTHLRILAPGWEESLGVLLPS